MTWAIVITLLVIGVVLSNLLLLRDSTKFHVPKNFKKNDDWDKDDWDKDDWDKNNWKKDDENQDDKNKTDCN